MDTGVSRTKTRDQIATMYNTHIYVVAKNTLESVEA